LNALDPQFGTQTDCKRILLKLFGQLLEFDGAPQVDEATRVILERYVGHEIEAGSYRDPLTLEHLSYLEFRAEIDAPTPGASQFHLGHTDPTHSPRHRPDNVNWQAGRSNLIQGNQTLRDARAWLVKVIARYMDLGEAIIAPGPDAP
jgi:hypothetical protein